MGVNYYQDDYNKNIPSPAPSAAPAASGNSSAVSPSTEVKKTKKSVFTKDGENSSASQTVTTGTQTKTEETRDVKSSSEPPKAQQTVDKEYQELADAIKDGTITEEQQARYDELTKQMEQAQKKAEQTSKEELTPDQKNKLNEYKKSLEQGGTQYEQTSRVMDKYLSKNDPNYQKLKTETEKRKYRDGLIHELQSVVNSSKKSETLSVSERKQGLSRIADLYILSDVSGKSIEHYASMDPVKLEKEFDAHEKMKMNAVMEAVDFTDPNLNADQKIHKFMEFQLANDEKYKSLENDKEAQEKYLQEKFASAISDHLALKITPEMLTGKRATILKNVMVGLMADAQIAQTEKGIDLTALFQDPKKLSNAILKSLEKQKDYIEKNFTPEEQADCKMLVAKMLTTVNIKSKSKNNNITERDIFEHLKANQKNLKAEQNDLLSYYEQLNKINPSALNEKADFESTVTLSIMFGKSIEEIADMGYEFVKDGKNISQDVAEKRLATFSVRFFKGDSCKDGKLAVKYQNKAMHEIVNNKQEYKALIEKYPEMEKTALSRVHKAIAKSRSNPEDENAQKALKYSVIASADYENIQEDIGKNFTIEESKKIFSDDTVQEAYSQNEQALNGFHKGFKLSHSKEEVLDLNQHVANNASTQFTALFTSSNIKTSNPEDQLYYAKELSKIKNAGITEGLAAAEKYVNDDIKQQYSSYVDDAVKNNGYSAEEINNIKKARETGKTSYEREIEAQKSEENKSTQKTDGNQTTSKNSQTNSANQANGSNQTVKTSAQKKSTPVTNPVTNAKVSIANSKLRQLNISDTTKTIAQQTKSLLAEISRMDSEKKKVEAMNKVADNIAKIQKDAIEREHTKEEQQKLQVQKQEIEKAKKENDAKTEAQIKEQVAITLNAEIEEAQAELSHSEEATEVQKQFGALFTELKTCAKDGQIDKVYTLLGKITPKAQEKFLEKLATKHISTVTHFIKSADPTVIKQLCELNPGLIATLDKNTLLAIGLEKDKIVKYGDKYQVASMLNDLQLASTKDTLKEFYEIMGIKDNEETPDQVVKKNDDITALVPGSPEWFARMQKNMSNASEYIALGSNTVGGSSYRFPEGTKKKLNPKEFWV